MSAPEPRAGALEALDHVVVAVRDRDAAAARAEALLGRPPAWLGEHPGAGTANALFPLANTYLELLAPVGEEALGAAVRARLDERGEGLMALAFRTASADAFAGSLRDRGLAAGTPRPGRGREARTGAERRWRSVLVPAEASRGVALLAIEHISGALAPPPPAPPDAGLVEALDHVVVLSPDLDAAGALYGGRLGLRLALDRSFPDLGRRILFFRVGGATLEVAGSPDPGARGEGPDRLWGLAWRVADLDAARARVEGRGLAVSEARPGAKAGTRVCTVRGGPLGVATLLIEPAPGPTPPSVR